MCQHCRYMLVIEHNQANPDFALRKAVDARICVMFRR